MTARVLSVMTPSRPRTFLAAGTPALGASISAVSFRKTLDLRRSRTTEWFAVNSPG